MINGKNYGNASFQCYYGNDVLMDVGKSLFACRVINAWNSLSSSADFRNVNVFKHSLFTAGLTKFLVCNT